MAWEVVRGSDDGSSVALAAVTPSERVRLRWVRLVHAPQDIVALLLVLCVAGVALAVAFRADPRLGAGLLYVAAVLGWMAFLRACFARWFGEGTDGGVVRAGGIDARFGGVTIWYGAGAIRRWTLAGRLLRVDVATERLWFDTGVEGAAVAARISDLLARDAEHPPDREVLARWSATSRLWWKERQLVKRVRPGVRLASLILVATEVGLVLVGSVGFGVLTASQEGIPVADAFDEIMSAIVPLAVLYLVVQVLLNVWAQRRLWSSQVSLGEVELVETAEGPMVVSDLRSIRYDWGAIVEHGVVDGCFALVVARRPAAACIPLEAFGDGQARRLEGLLRVRSTMPSDAPDGAGPTPSGPPSWAR